MGQPKFEIFKGKDEAFYFHLKAGNGEVILASQGYTAKASCQNGISSVATNSKDEANFEKKVAKDGRFYFVLHAANKQIIGNSQMYTTSSARDHGIHSVHDNATQAVIEDLTKE
ncbi:YegP family protein [Reichenbachiella agariperforans]|uniref:YegP family protein n=1 Tax=Reichenbachiella agariperforans TaxID=156994 RepID=UPI001C08F85A|nr:YegP family protein [Reichenbachiella agariperforans]MBU2912715.1 YegP family protein [Reichenbachiella agariperforans]